MVRAEHILVLFLALVGNCALQTKAARIMKDDLGHSANPEHFGTRKLMQDYFFPYSRCNHEPAVAPFNLVYKSEIPVPGPWGNQMCFTIQARKGCDDLSGEQRACCSDITRTLHKIQLEADPKCDGAISLATINAVPKSFQFITNLGPTAIVRLTNINLPIIPGTDVCLYLRNPCPSLDKLCINGECRYALYSAPNPVACCAMSP
eukprot:CAMPEP_0202915098 /NCGR_PEP_ID=MMETSP1392-20130828/64818_1 /ASSEMBLY_ACC=CAM_ASM_000868 /TAXON_ID=225041 /ORGANISM="Chlamydomonas chlamydogama, Strain SAG 11-48b" /LENGTH=204 /DNA_ID=CAMNT_0049606995 /DNA_START=195 /DNA_END=806 /DNA_ORIENTATION=-